ncbi:MAG: [dimethylamine--corrinoid protein] Co-methyltransferase [Deltaproteobacteria bacterium]|nr:[dimethylamine--corrinoid protein] Co-methyltransferase [Deltaproteobacteria bacterium]MBW2480389.1 [dimethylamine--corrinoid protein] Co-methyltransferase [Deltaproteobacteria bacterium]
MKSKISIRMGDGELVSMSSDEIREDIMAATQEAAQRADIPELTTDEIQQLVEIMAEPSRVVSVNPGQEVIVTDDGCSMSFYSGQDGGGVGVPLSRLQAILTYERACAADTTSMGHSDYSFKPVKPIINFEMNEYYTASMMTTAPFLYGAQPNMGLYFQPDGPHPNPADLLPRGKIKEAQQVQEAAAEQLRQDLVFVGKKLNAVGCEGLNFDTAGSAGDADYWAALQAICDLKQAAPNMPVILGGSGEFVLGMHAEVTFNGQRLAGMYPHQQAKIAQAAGASIYGVAVGTNTNESVGWNIARTLTFVKEAVAAVDIPVHVNVGMGVGGVPMMEAPPIDSVTRASKSLVQIGKADGL